MKKSLFSIIFIFLVVLALPISYSYLGDYDNYYNLKEGSPNPNARAGCVIEDDTEFYDNINVNPHISFGKDKFTCEGFNQENVCDLGSFIPCEDDEDCNDYCSLEPLLPSELTSAICTEIEPGKKYCQAPVRHNTLGPQTEEDNVYYWCHPCRRDNWWGPGIPVLPYTRDVQPEGIGQPCDSGEVYTIYGPQWTCPEPFTCIDNICRADPPGGFEIEGRTYITNEGHFFHRTGFHYNGVDWSPYLSKSDYQPYPIKYAENLCDIGSSYDDGTIISYFSLRDNSGDDLLATCKKEAATLENFKMGTYIKGEFYQEVSTAALNTLIDESGKKFIFQTSTDPVAVVMPNGDLHVSGVGYNFFFMRSDSQLFPGGLIGPNSIIPVID